MNQDLATFLAPQSMLVFILVMSRISGMIVTAPLFSTFPIPPMVKVGLSALSAFIMYPLILNYSNFQVPHDLVTMGLLVFKELFVGILIGFCAGIIFVGIQIGGQLLSLQMGLTIAEAMDPVTKQHVPIIGQYYLFTASLVFIYLNGYQWLFNAVYDSYKTIPISLNFEFTTQIVDKILIFIGQLFPIAFGIIMPIFALLFITDIALALVSKMMPQMNIFMVGLPLKIYVGLFFMAIYIIPTASYLSGLIQTLLDNMGSIFT